MGYSSWGHRESDMTEVTKQQQNSAFNSLYLCVYFILFASFSVEIYLIVCTLEKEMATHFSILAWKIPWMEEPGRATVHGVTKSWTRLSDLKKNIYICAESGIVVWGMSR